MEWYAWQGSNLRPSVPETDALVQLSYRRTGSDRPTSAKNITSCGALSIECARAKKVTFPNFAGAILAPLPQGASEAIVAV